MAGEVIGVQGVRITDLPEAEAVVDSNYMILVDEKTGITYKVKREHIKAQKTSELVDDVGFLRAIPDEYMTESEVREFTNAEIAQIREVLNTWEAFKNTGGEIGGDISTTKVKSPMLVNESEYTVGMWNKGFGVESTDKYGSWAFVGTNNQHLGHPNSPWADLHLSGVSKSANGYTKLPNGFIIQWGHRYLSNDLGTGIIYTTISFPMQFPGDICHVYLTPCVNQYAINDEYGSSWERPPVVYKITPSNFEFAFQRLQGHFGSEIRWFAIGY